MMQVWVELPIVCGDTVTFRWSQSEVNAFQAENSFFFRFENLELRHFSVELFYEMFLALQLRVFAGYHQPVEIHFPTPVPSNSAAYWSAYHDAANVSIRPISTSGTYNPWADQPKRVSRPRKNAVFYGGGKDSVLATCMLSEIDGADEVVVIQFVGPLKKDPKHAKEIEERQEALMLEPARRVLGVATQRGWTDYQANFLKQGLHLRPHLELYTAGALPAMLAWGIGFSTFTANWAIMSTEHQRNRGVVHRYAPSRPRWIEAQSRHYAATLGVPIEVGNVLLPFHALAAHWMLAERYPLALDIIVSCTQAPTNQRWCHVCSKCSLFAFLSLSTGTMAKDFDYDRLLTKSPFIRRALEYAESGAELTSLGNARWIPTFFTGIRSFILGCHMIARIEIEELQIKLSPAARSNLILLQAMYGNQLYPNYETVPRVMIEFLGPTLSAHISRIVGEHLEIVDYLPSPNYAGNSRIEYRVDVPLPERIASLPHLQLGPSN